MDCEMCNQWVWTVLTLGAESMARAKNIAQHDDMAAILRQIDALSIIDLFILKIILFVRTVFFPFINLIYLFFL